MPDSDPSERADADAYVGKYDKLVRDDVPAVVRDDGNEPVTRIVDGAEYRRYLAAKLVEEASEYADALETTGEPGDGRQDVEDDDGVKESGDDAVLDELADVHAILDAVVDASDYSPADVHARQRAKAIDRGAFEDSIVLERIDPGD